MFQIMEFYDECIMVLETLWKWTQKENLEIQVNPFYQHYRGFALLRATVCVSAQTGTHHLEWRQWPVHLRTSVKRLSNALLGSQWIFILSKRFFFFKEKHFEISFNNYFI